jgi:NADH:ubiquinone oxidoreductase subunit E
MAQTQVEGRPTPQTDEEKQAALREFIEEVKTREQPDSHLIAVLHRTQELFGYLPNEAMTEIAEAMQIPTAHIWGVATFYHYFKLTPPGRYEIAICLGSAC